MASVRLRPITRRLTRGGGTGMPFRSKLALRAAVMVAPLSTSVPSQSKIASLFATTGHFLDRRDNVFAPGPALAFDRRHQIRAGFRLIELARSANDRRLDLKSDNGLGHRFELAG